MMRKSYTKAPKNIFSIKKKKNIPFDYMYSVTSTTENMMDPENLSKKWHRIRCGRGGVGAGILSNNLGKEFSMYVLQQVS